ncbi:hypothetical protein AND_006134 [Anopheles darlingi]|uniref:Rho-GAP domain-containing protein n=1 Tax=Anopheles darlingi TaxID=43151 RepID=W5JCV9_ANODA|nr:hypothetical protein AND_006134 [Anopheles darlingi]
MHLMKRHTRRWQHLHCVNGGGGGAGAAVLLLLLAATTAYYLRSDFWLNTPTPIAAPVTTADAHTSKYVKPLGVGHTLCSTIGPDFSELRNSWRTNDPPIAHSNGGGHRPSVPKLEQTCFTNHRRSTSKPEAVRAMTTCVDIIGLLMSLPGHTQRLLVLLFGTFRVIASNSERADTGMTSEALGVSVAPSFFQSCVSDGKTARMKDVLRFKHLVEEQQMWFAPSPGPYYGKHRAFDGDRTSVVWYSRTSTRRTVERKLFSSVHNSLSSGIKLLRADWFSESRDLFLLLVPTFLLVASNPDEEAEVHVATKIMKQMIEQFTACDLFGRVNYEYYVRVTGRVLRVQDEWICSFRYPPPPRGKTAQQNYAFAQEESHSTPALLTTGGPNVGNSAVSLGIIPEHSLLESCARLSVSLEGPGIFNVQKTSCSSSSHSSSSTTRSGSQHHMTLDELQAVNRYAESTKSLSYLPQVHERQAARMRTRSEWFLGARGSSLELCHDGGRGGVGGTNSLIHPPIVTSTPIPGTVGHHPHGIIGTYGSIDNLNDLVVVVVDVNQDRQQQSHTQYSNLHSNHHHQHHHNHGDENYHRSTANLHPCDNPVVQRSPKSEQELGMLSSQPQHSTCSDNRSSMPHPNEPIVTEHASVHRRSVVEAYTKDSAQDAITEYYSDRSHSTSEGNDELDGDEHDFAISQGHHFDQRAENRRRRRRRALLRRNSYDQIVSSGSFLPAANDDCCRPKTATNATNRNVRDIAGSGGEGVSSRPLTTTVSVDERRAMNRSSRNPSNHYALSSAEMPPSDVSPSNIPSANANASLSRNAESGKQSRPSAIGRNRSNSSVTLRNGSSTSSIARQSNLSTIVFSVASAESVHQSAKRPSRRGGSRHGHLHRSSSRRNKENGASRSNSFRNKAKGTATGTSSTGTAAGGGTVGVAGGVGVDPTVINNALAAATGMIAAGPTGPAVAGGRIRKQRAVSFEQTSATTALTMTTSTSVSGTVSPAAVGYNLMHSPRVWHEYASKSLDEKKLLTKQNNIGNNSTGGTIGSMALVDGTGDESVVGGTHNDGVTAGLPIGRRSIVSVCVNDRQVLDSDGDWPMAEDGGPQGHHPYHHLSQHHHHHHHQQQQHHNHQQQQQHHHHHHHHHHPHHHSGGSAGGDDEGTEPGNDAEFSDDLYQDGTKLLDTKRAGRMVGGTTVSIANYPSSGDSSIGNSSEKLPYLSLHILLKTCHLAIWQRNKPDNQN